jgi:hypothetical protein
MVCESSCLPVFTFHLNNHHKPNSNQPQIHHPRPVFSTAPPTSLYSLQNISIYNHPLGEGTYGVVNLAIPSPESNTSNIPLIPLQQLACKTVIYDPDLTINQEVQILRMLDHPNVLGLLDLIEERELNRMHMIQELAMGGDLFAYIEKHDGLSEREVSFINWQLVEGLTYLHDMGIVHRGELHKGKLFNII